MVDPTPIPPRQLALGPAAYFRVTPEDPVGNQVRVARGYAFAGAHSISDQFTGVPATGQLTAAFSPVAAATQRYDLVYLDINGAAQILQGTAVAFGSPAFQGAPGQATGPDLPGVAIPVAYVFIEETGAVLVDLADITELGGQFHVTNSLVGVLVDRGLFGSAPAGASDDVSAIFAADTPSNGSSERGVVTQAPFNYSRLLDQKGDEILHVSGARVYGRLTEAAGTWTLSYFYLDGAGSETALTDISDPAEVPATPTDLRLAGIAEIYSWNDPSRPLFDSSFQRISDQIVGDVPTATTVVQGKALKADNPNTQPAIPQIGTIAEIQNNSVEVAGGPWHTLNFPSGGIAAGGGPGILDINAAGAPGPPGPPGPTGPTGPTGPGFSSQGPWSQQNAAVFPSRSGSFVFNFGFTVRFYMVDMHFDDPSAALDVAYVTAVTPSGTQVTVNWTTDDAGSDDGVGFRVGCSAAG